MTDPPTESGATVVASRPLRVAHVDTERGWRGGEEQMRRLVRGLARGGNESLVVVRSGSAAAERMRGEPALLEVLPLRSEFDLASAWRLGRILRREACDVVHAHTSHAATLANVAARLAGGIPLVVSRRLDFPLRGKVMGRIKYTWGVDRILAVADAVKRRLEEAGIPPATVRVVRSACELDAFDRLPDRAEARSLLGLSLSGRLVVCVAALAGHKDLGTFLRVVEALRRDRPDLRAALVGEGPQRREMEAMRRRLGLDDVVLMPGHSDRVPLWLAAGDLFLLTSLREGIGGALLEAQAARLPVVATRVSGLPEAVREGETALLEAAQDVEGLARSAGRVLDDPALGRRMGAAGRAWVEAGFGLDRLVRETLEAYREAIDAWCARGGRAG